MADVSKVSAPSSGEESNDVVPPRTALYTPRGAVDADADAQGRAGQGTAVCRPQATRRGRGGLDKVAGLNGWGGAGPGEETLVLASCPHQRSLCGMGRR